MELDADLVVAATDLSVNLELASADGVILATARAVEATVWTQDIDLVGLNGVECRAHRN